MGKPWKVGLGHTYFWNPKKLTGWWYTYPSEKYEFVSWDYYSQYMESHKIHVPNHQPVYPYEIRNLFSTEIATPR